MILNDLFAIQRVERGFQILPIQGHPLPTEMEPKLFPDWPSCASYLTAQLTGQGLHR